MDSIFNYPSVLAIMVALPLMGIVAKFFKVSFERIAKWYLYVGVFAVVIVMNSIFFPFIGGKDYFLRYAVELSLIALILYWAFEAKKGEVENLIKTTFKKPLVIAVSVFVLMFLLACLFGYDAHAAFWSNYERGEGGFMMIHYYLFFLLLAMLVRTEEEWKNLFKFSLVAAGLMIIYGLFGDFGTSGFIGPYSGTTAPTGWWNQLIQGRFEGSLGNPAYVAPYLIFSMFFAGYLWLRRKANSSMNMIVNIGYGLLIAVFLFFFILSQTRGAFIGLGAGVFVLLLYVAFTSGNKVRNWSLGVLALLVVLGGIGFAVRNSKFVQNLPEGRLLQLSLNDSTAQTRLWVWGEAWKGFLDRPILGWGPENFTTVFDKYFDPRFFVPGQSTETWFDRAHSVFFDYLTETGILGLLSYLGIFFVFFWEFFKKKTAQANAGMSSLTKGLILAVPVAYLVQGIAIFDVLPMYLCLFIFLAFASHYFSRDHSGQNVSQHHTNG